MKKLNLVFIAFLAITIGFTSCTKTETEYLEAAPVITLDDAAGISATAGTDVIITGDIVAEGKLKSVKFLINGTQTGETVESFTDPLKYDIRLTVSGTSITETFTFKVVALDKNDKTSEKELTVTVSAVDGTAWTSASTTGTVNHAFGPAKGGYDLVSGTQVSLGTTGDFEDVDIKNLSAFTTPDAAFDASFRSGTSRSTTFAKLTDVDFDNSYVESVSDNMSGAISEVSNPAEGDVYGALLSDGTTYVIIKIDVVSLTGSDGKGGEGFMKFLYKKGTLPSKN